MHDDYVITTPLHDTEEDSIEVESSSRKVALPDDWKWWWKFCLHFTWLLINSLDRDV